MRLLWVLAIVSVAQCAERPKLVLDPKLATKITDAAVKCQVELGVDPIILQKLLPWKLEESETNGKFLVCLMGQLKFSSQDGHLDIERFMELFNDSLKLQNVDGLRNLLEECNKETGKNSYYTIYKIANCFHTRTPVVMSLQ
ncbi:GTPase-activating Rap/Ran-GAP domain-like protein 3 [Battus philenor]|uniref:GTPase-activating Rap/Ran-GAP domain-like protein 3 n=1 Tax=Battus philenor TaxID=42288 RepID=UPI0035D0A79E